MAKRRGSRKAKRTTTRRTKSSKKMGSVNLQLVAYSVGGAVASRFIVNSLGKLIPQLTSSSMNKAISQIALGFVAKPLAGLLGSKSANVAALATGMMVGGAYELLKTSVPAAFGQAEGDDVIVVSGMDISEINGMDDIGMDISEINGMDDIGMNYGDDYND